MPDKFLNPVSISNSIDTVPSDDGFIKVYGKTDNRIYGKNALGEEYELSATGAFVEAKEYQLDSVIDDRFDAEVHLLMEYEQGTVETGSTTKEATIEVIRQGAVVYSRLVRFGNLGVAGQTLGGVTGLLNPVTDAVDVLSVLNYRDQKSLTVYVPNGCTIRVTNADPQITSEANGAIIFNKRSF